MLSIKNHTERKQKHTSTKKIAMAIITFASASQSIDVNAQTETQRIADLERKLQSALSTIEKLSDKVETLESAETKSATHSNSKFASFAAIPAPITAEPVSKTDTQQNNTIDSLQQQVKQLSSSSSSRIIPFDWLHGFADVGGGYQTNGSPQGFAVGSLDLYMTPKISGQVKTLAELLFEYDERGELETDLERAQIGYSFSDAFTINAGRFHTPYGYWQTAYHHGQQIQPSLTRARFIDFEDRGGILPAHTTGLWGTGGMKLGDGKFNYDLYVGNTPKITLNTSIGKGNLGSLDGNYAGFSNESLSVGGKLGYAFSGGVFDGLDVGIHGMHSEVKVDDGLAANGLTNNKVDMNMGGGYAYYNNHNWEIITEAYGFMNYNPNQQQSLESWAGFVHAGYAIDKFMPYARLERADTDRNDMYFNSMALGYAYSREAAGVRYDINTQSSLKLELDYTQPQLNQADPLKEFWGSRVQYAVRF